MELLNAIYCLAELLEFAAFIALRITAPHLPRPYRCGPQGHTALLAYGLALAQFLWHACVCCTGVFFTCCAAA